MLVHNTYTALNGFVSLFHTLLIALEIILKQSFNPTVYFYPNGTPFLSVRIEVYYYI